MPTITVNNQNYEVPQSALDTFLSTHAKRELTDEELLRPVNEAYLPDTIYAWLSKDSDSVRDPHLVAFAKMRAVADRLNEGKIGPRNYTFFWNGHKVNDDRYGDNSGGATYNGFTFHTAEDRDRFVRLLEPEIRVFLGVS